MKFFNNSKSLLMKSSNQKWNRGDFQGKSKENYQTSAEIVFWCFVFAFIISAVAIFFKFFF